MRLSSVPADLSLPSKPLVDLHRHLEGSIRPSTAYELAARHGIGRSGDAGWRARYVAAEREAGLLPYLAKIDAAARVARSLDDWRRIAGEAVADAVDDGLTAVELRFAPQFIASMTGLDADRVIEAVRGAVAESPLPIDVGLIGIVVRDEGPDSGMAQMERLLRHADGLVGVDLAGDEAGYPAARFAPAFRLAHERGIPVTVHAGEAAGPESVWAALEHLHPQRIGHGVRSAEDPRLVAQLAETGVTLEVAISSNVQTGAASSRDGHQLAELVRSGVRVALCTDNPTVSATTLSRELQLATKLVGPEITDRLCQHADHARFDRAEG